VSNAPNHFLEKFRALAWHWLMGMALGVLCGGLRLMTSAPYSRLLAEDPALSLSRLGFLVAMGMVFGLGATLTGAIFLRRESAPSS
jgi:membrane-associated PAP2 superfamily phosphatase